MNYRSFLIIAMASLLLASKGYAQKIDFSDAAIFVPEKNNTQLKRAAQVLQEEIAKRSGLQLPLTFKKPPENKKAITICIESRINNLPDNIRSAMQNLQETGKEGFKIIMNNDKSVIIAGHEEAGALYGAGWLLRKMEIRDKKVLLPGKFNISSSPTYPTRGHQLGYRPKTNAYDAWSVGQYESYILAIQAVSVQI
jgi:alpha-glucuronidase